MLSSQEEQADRKEVLENERRLGLGPKGSPLSDAEKAALEKKIDEAKRASTYLAHVEPPVGGRHAQPQTVVGKSGSDPWPKLPASSPWSGEQPGPGAERSFGQQLHSFDVSQTTVQEKRR
jgi:hypothetical protein